MADSDSSSPQECPTGYCPHFQHAVELIGRRWTGTILKVIGGRSLRFTQIAAEIPGLSDRLLDTRLTEMEGEGIVVRLENPPGVRYTLTPKGQAMAPIFLALVKWSLEHRSYEEGDTPGRQRF